MTAIWRTGVLPRTSGRVAWVDAGKGLAIVLVVLFHTANWTAIMPLDTSGWQAFNGFVATLRMPLFFALSGLFAAKWLTVPFADLWSKKLALFVWVFLLWTVVAVIVFQLAHIVEGEPLSWVGQFIATIRAPLFPRFELWFLWALTLAFLAARLMRRVPSWVQLVVFGLISALMLTDSFAFFVPEWQGALRYFFFFLLGLHLRRLIIDYAERSGWVLRCLSIATWAIYAAVVAATGAGVVFGVQFVNALLGVLAGVALSQVLARLPGLARLGGRTLPVYVAHTPFVILIVTPLSLWGAGPALQPWVSLVVPAVAAAAVALSLGLKMMADGSSRLSWLFTAPAFFRGVPSRHAPRQR